MKRSTYGKHRSDLQTSQLSPAPWDLPMPYMSRIPTYFSTKAYFSFFLGGGGKGWGGEEKSKDKPLSKSSYLSTRPIFARAVGRHRRCLDLGPPPRYLSQQQSTSQVRIQTLFPKRFLMKTAEQQGKKNDQKKKTETKQRNEITPAPAPAHAEMLVCGIRPNSRWEGACVRF